MVINTLAALAWGLLTVNTQTGEYTVIRGIDSQAQCERLGESISGPDAWFTCTSYPARSLDQLGEDDEALE
jgi:hypothetical protein